ncbi:heat-inducible transcription repressor HrcA [Desulfonatronum thiosulfatophilum]|uniref:Heat-inducible transcription repressor HrcA n=1 Tax=Desulfonatronum thiosulfatophilum TaxID=617002 RepID=A0A1G6CBC6_9BACT|nr:heat-inducible transcriptional repressor HrcA [Desulfonatronum thiosulfatophilum]SDB30163.1 heat-inducible transcription repressor HrcA [Desulfonatronum thiosulfatophilum]
MELQAREIGVLVTLIEDYIQTAAPVGSRTIAKKSNLNLSPASIRNIMADLTEKGYLEQPHTSAGRIPSSQGFRFYVDSLMKYSPLSPEERNQLAASLGDGKLDVSELLRNASRLLSAYTRQVSMILAPKATNIGFKHIDFILLKAGLAMAILVVEGGIVRNKIVTIDPELGTDDLTKYSNYLNQLFQGRTLSQVRSKLLQEMDAVQREYQAVSQQALVLAQQVFSENSPREMFVEGTVNFFTHPEFANPAKLQELLRMLEERTQLLEILDKVSKPDGISIIFGREEDQEGLREFTLISSPYLGQDDPLGVVGIIGPIRMDYAKVVPLVEFTAQVISRLLKNRF